MQITHVYDFVVSLVDFRVGYFFDKSGQDGREDLQQDDETTLSPTRVMRGQEAVIPVWRVSLWRVSPFCAFFSYQFLFLPAPTGFR